MTTSLFESGGGLLVWLATVTLHAGVLILLAWGIRRAWKSLGDQASEWLWRAALFGPVVTATVQLQWVDQPLAGFLVDPAMALEETTGEVATVESPEVSAPFESLPDAPSEVRTREQPTTVVTSSDVHPGESATTFDARWIGWALILPGMLVLLLRGHVSRRFLARRRPLQGAEKRLEALRSARNGLGARIRFGFHDELATPVAFGILRPEVCLPTRALAPGEHRFLKGMVEHELAHHRRCDPLWVLMGALVCHVFFWMPLFRLPARRLRSLAEFQCDRAAARGAGSKQLARCLVEVATWVAEGQQRVARACGMAVERSELVGRVDRLLAAERPRGRMQAVVVGLAAFCVLGLVSVAFPALVAEAAVPSGAVGVANAWTPVSDLEVTTPGDRERRGLVDALDAGWSGVLEELGGLEKDLESIEPDEEITALLSAFEIRFRKLESRRRAIRKFLEEESPRASEGRSSDSASHPEHGGMAK